MQNKNHLPTIMQYDGSQDGSGAVSPQVRDTQIYTSPQMVYFVSELVHWIHLVKFASDRTVDLLWPPGLPGF